MRYIVLLEYRIVRYLVMGLERALMKRRRKVRVLRERLARGMRGLERLVTGSWD